MGKAFSGLEVIHLVRLRFSSEAYMGHLWGF